MTATPRKRFLVKMKKRRAIINIKKNKIRET